MLFSSRFRGVRDVGYFSKVGGIPCGYVSNSAWDSAAGEGKISQLWQFLRILKSTKTCVHIHVVYTVYTGCILMYMVLFKYLCILNDQKLIDHRPSNGALCTGYEETTTQCWSPLNILQVWFSNMEWTICIFHQYPSIVSGNATCSTCLPFPEWSELMIYPHVFLGQIFPLLVCVCVIIYYTYIHRHP